LLTKNDAILITLGCLIGILLTMVIIPLVQPAYAPVTAIPPASTGEERIPAVTGITTTVDALTTKEDVVAFIRAHTLLAPPSASIDYTAVAVPAGSRSYSFDIDTSTFRPDEYIVTVQAIIQDATAAQIFNVFEQAPQNSRAASTPAPGTQSSGKDGFTITINPIGDKIVGQKFQITGSTNLPSDAEILIQVYSSSFKPTQKSQSGEFSGATGTVRIASPSQPMAVPTALSTRAPAMVPTSAAAGAKRQYSRTNIQVNEVDEADIIKTDGDAVYVVINNCLHILKAYPAANAEILSTLRFSGQPVALYVYDDRVVLIASEHNARSITHCSPGKCGNYYSVTPQTTIYIFSVNDPANPQLVREIAIDGSYTSSRMIGSRIYYITSTPIPYQLDDLVLPTIHDDRGGITTPQVFGFNTTDRAFTFSTIGSADVGAITGVTAKSFLVGTAATVYVSPTHIYIAVADETTNTRPVTTTIHSFAIDNGRISYAAGGKVDGTLLNQYSLDESDTNLRVATTIPAAGSWQMNAGSSSKITILDKNLDILGTLPDIAPTERIYAARFMGDRLYLVTFRQTDPFYVIDLSNPRKPAVLGELKLPGFSNYLHPYDANHIIGIGKESQSGPIKLALFDVSDVRNPALKDSELLGESYSTSAVLDDPKAFLFDREKDLLVLPVHLVSGDAWCPPTVPCTPQSVWGGAYVYGVNTKTGFVLKGKVLHYETHYGSQSPVKRALYIEDTLYTMSDTRIVMSDLARSLERINEIDFR
jgi:uncharacterized secreted protein with C-terminal beta-propeller domain